MKQFNLFKTIIFSLAISSGLQAQTDGRLDLDYAPTGLSAVRAIKQLADGRIIVSNSSYIAGNIRIYKADGSDAGINFFPLPGQTEFSNNWVSCILQQQDGKVILLGGNGTPKVFRYDLNGKPDTTFKRNIGEGANMTVRKGLLDKDGKIVIIGDFTSFNGVPKSGIVRLNPDGTIDKSFITTTQNSTIRDVIHNEKGGYFIGGLLNGINQQYTYTKTVKLKYDGSVDSSFKTYYGNFRVLALQPDGKLLGLTDNLLTRMNKDGSEDLTTPMGNGDLGGVQAGSSNAQPVGMHVQKDGKIIITGNISKYNSAGTSTPVNHVFRINPGGTFDNTFNPGTGPNRGIVGSEFLEDGSILLAGSFDSFDGNPRTFIARLKNSGLPYKAWNTSVGISETGIENDWLVYPNPASDFVRINSSESISRINIINSIGQTVLSAGDKNNAQIDVSSLSPGIYFLEAISNRNHRSVERLVVN